MKAFWAFTKKEFLEYWRTYKILILALVFLLFGMMNPVVAKFTPEIIKAAGVDINLPDPTAMDSWAQFFKNVGQMGMLVVIIVFSGIMANELSKGTLITMLTKGLTRRTVILSKFLVASVLWTLAYLLCLGVTAVYTAVFWPMDGLHQVFWVFFALWLYIELLIALLVLGGVLFKNSIGSLLLAGGAVLIMTLISIFPDVHPFNPMSLATDNLALLSGLSPVADLYPAFVVCGALTVTVIALSVVVFDHRAI
jgi:ABC-2 type transport system permease protein